MSIGRTIGLVKNVDVPGERTRHYYIDWLRIWAVVLLFPYHTTRIFDIWEPFYIKSDETSELLTYCFITTIDAWHMPLFFLLAGMSTLYALRFRSIGQYMRERFSRLFIPLVVGLLIVIPPQSYIGAMSKGLFSGSIFAYIDNFFSLGPDGLSGYSGGFTPGHLWFILFLFIIALAALPVCRYLLNSKGRRFVERMAPKANTPLFLWAPPALLFLTLPLPAVGDKNIFYYFLFFMFGFIFPISPEFENGIEKYRNQAFLMAIICFSSLFLLFLTLNPFPEWLENFANMAFPTFICWWSIIAILGYGKKKLNFSNRLMRYAGSGAYPVYILHQTVIVVVGYYTLQIIQNTYLQWGVVLLAGGVMTLILYEVIKRIPFLRQGFGIKVIGNSGL